MCQFSSMIVDLTEDDNNESHRDRSLTVPVLPEMSSLAIPPLVVPAPVVPPQNTARTSGFQAPFLAPSISLSQIYRDGNGGQRVNLGEMARMIQNQGQRALSASMASQQRQIPFQAHYLPCPFPPSMPSQQLPALSASTRVLPSTVTTGHAPQSAYAANMAMRQIALPPPKVVVAGTLTFRDTADFSRMTSLSYDCFFFFFIVEPLSVRFSIIDSFNFTARAETGKVTDNIINCLKRTPGAKFDRRNSRWLFPISSHQILRSALSHQRCHVEPVPQHVLVATQLKLSAVESSSSSSAAGSSSTLDLLRQHLPQKVLDNLASFQQEAVKFIFDKGGRALIADEMGLGNYVLCVCFLSFRVKKTYASFDIHLCFCRQNAHSDCRCYIVPRQLARTRCLSFFRTFPLASRVANNAFPRVDCTTRNHCCGKRAALHRLGE